MKRFLLGFAALILLAGGAAIGQNVLNYQEQGGARWVVGGALDVVSGGALDVVSGGALEIAGVDRTAALATAPAGVASGYKIARGQATTASAADTIATGLATVVSVVCALDSDPGDDPEWVSCTIGDQAGSPTAGSVILKTWKNTSGTDPTPAAASTFSKKVNWIAVGT